MKMSDLEEQFQAFLREPLSTDDSRSIADNPKTSPVPVASKRKFWWLKEQPEMNVRSREVPDLVRPSVQLRTGETRTALRLSLDLGPPSPEHDASASTSDFVKEERICQEQSKEPAEGVGDTTDDEISSILEEMSRLASSSGLSQDAGLLDKSVEEILKEAEEVVRESSHTFEQLAHSSSRSSVRSNSESCDLVPSRISTPLKLGAIKKLGSFDVGSKFSSYPSTDVHSKGKQQLSLRSSSSSEGHFAIPAEKVSESSQRSESDGMKRTVSMPVEIVSSTSIVLEKSSDHSEKSDPYNRTVTKMNTSLNQALSNGFVNGKVDVDESFIASEKVQPQNDNFNTEKVTQGPSEKILDPVCSKTREGAARGVSVSRLRKSPPRIKKPEKVVTFGQVSSRRPRPVSFDGDRGIRRNVFRKETNQINGRKKSSISQHKSREHPITEPRKVKSAPRSISCMEIVSRARAGDEEKTGSDVVIETREMAIKAMVDRPDSVSQSTVDSVLQLVGEAVQAEVEAVTRMVEVPHAVGSLMQPSQKSEEKLDERASVLLATFQQHHSLDEQLREEQMRCEKLRADLISAEKEHRRKVDALTEHYEKMVMELKKDICVLRAKVAQLESTASNPTPSAVPGADVRVSLLEEELQRQEQLITSYQQDNERLCQELRQLQEQAKAREQLGAMKGVVSSEDLDKRISQLEAELHASREEVEKWRQQAGEAVAEKHQLQGTVSELRSDLERLQARLQTAKSPKSPVTPSKAVRFRPQDVAHVAELEREMRSLRRELATAQEEMKKVRIAKEKERCDSALQRDALEASVGELNAELSRQRARAAAAEEAARRQASELQDATRQVRELERIVKRNPAAAQFSGVLSHGSPEVSPRVKELETRLHELETQLLERERQAKEAEQTLQALKVQYEERVSDMELRLQTERVRQQHGVGRSGDAHLVATVRGLQQELSAQQTEVRRLSRELEEQRRLNKRLQKERERLLQQQQPPKGDPRKEPLAPAGSTAPSVGENVSTEQELRTLNSLLKEDLQSLKAEFDQLKNKRLQDLSLLHEQHMEELTRIREEMAAARPEEDARMAELQGQLATQQLVIEHLRGKLAELDVCQEEILILKTERDHLESSVTDLRKKISSLQDQQEPEHVQLVTLRTQLASLEQRHEAREKRLQAAVESLLQRNAEQHRRLAELHADEDSAALRCRLLEKNRQLSEYRVEMDRILAALRTLHREERLTPAV